MGGPARNVAMLPTALFDQGGNGSAAPSSQQQQSAGLWLLRFAPCARTIPAVRVAIGFTSRDAQGRAISEC